MTDLRQQALDYHQFPVPGKTAVCLTKPARTSKDLALAYSPGVAEPVREIASKPANAYRIPTRATLWQLSPTGLLFWVWEILARWHPSR